MVLVAVKTGWTAELLYERFTSSHDYIDAVCSRNNEESKRQSIAGLHALLFLLDHTGQDASRLVLAREKGGRPYFENSELHFSLSHSGELAVCALSEFPVGADIERMRDKNNIESFANRFFSKKECAIISDSEDKKRAFFQIWTRKEAWLKSNGAGVDCDLSRIDTTEKEYYDYGITDGNDEYVVSIFGKGIPKIIGGIKWKERK